jgi:collagenase-like PrtC family protease
MHKIELLSPARDAEIGIEAFNHGADAVYIGAPRFSARAAAGCSVADIERLTAYGHRYGARTFVALNTILTDEELRDAERLSWQLYEAGVDALIVQDYGLLTLDLPPMELHASTQMDTRTPEKARLLRDLGMSRVVLARELSIEQISRIHEAVPVELECFVHGALCVSVSGQCYLSAALTGRSANRGACAQPCRLPMELVDANGRTIVRDKHLLSLKDMNRSAELEALIAAGVTSLKIEGRLKDVTYVKNLTAYYRRRIDALLEDHPDWCAASDGHCTYTFEPRPAASFNRGFTNYYATGNRATEAGRREVIWNMDTPKSMGERLGRVGMVGRDFFRVTVEGASPGTSNQTSSKVALGITPSQTTSKGASGITPSQATSSEVASGITSSQATSSEVASGITPSQTSSNHLIPKVEVGETSFSPILNNGDGLVAQDRDGQIYGFRLNRIDPDTQRLYPAGGGEVCSKLRSGMTLYRNADQRFEQLLSKPSADRRVAVDMCLTVTTECVSLTLTDERGNSVTETETGAYEVAQKPQQENYRKQLSKLGDTCFTPRNWRVSLPLARSSDPKNSTARDLSLTTAQPAAQDLFLPSSMLADLRRRACARLTQLRAEVEAERRKAFVRPDYQAAADRIDARGVLPDSYLANVMNHGAEQLLRRMKIAEVAPAYELKSVSQCPVMFTAHCLKFALGCCPKYQHPKARWAEPWSLKIGGRKFVLKFGCQNDCYSELIATFATQNK